MGHKKSDMTWWLNNNKPGQGASQVTLVVKNPWFCSLGREDPLKEGVATHSSLLAWKSSRTEEPGGLQSMGSHRVGHDWSDLASMQANWNRILRSVCCKLCRHLCIAKVRKVLMWEASWSNRAYEGQKFRQRPGKTLDGPGERPARKNPELWMLMGKNQGWIIKLSHAHLHHLFPFLTASLL